MGCVESLDGKAPFKPLDVTDDGLAVQHLHAWMKHLKAKTQGKVWAARTAAEIDELDLANLGLAALPPDFGRLVFLEKLYLQDNRLTTVPPMLGHFPSLRSLWLQDNLLTALPAELGLLKSLQELWVGKNQLGEIPPELGQLSALKLLDLKANQLLDLPPELGQLRALRKLQVDKNRLSSIPAELGELTTLRILLIEDNRLRAVPEELAQLRSLEILSLSGNRLQGVPDGLGQFSALRELNLSSNQLQSFPPELNDLKNLRVLKIRKNRTTGPFNLLPLFNRLANDVKATIQVCGNHFDPITFGDEDWMSGELHEPMSTQFGESSICLVSFPGTEFLNWRLFLTRCRLRPVPLLWSQLCTFLPDFGNARKSRCARSESHAGGLGSGICRAFGRYFDAAGAQVKRAGRPHEKFGCCWFQQWTKRVDLALEMGHRRFLVFTKTDGTIGASQCAEWFYLLECKLRFKDLVVECVSVSESMSVLEYGPLLKGDDFRSDRFRVFPRPADLPEALNEKFSRALKGPIRAERI